MITSDKRRLTVYVSKEDFRLLQNMAEENYRDIWEQASNLLHVAAVEYREKCLPHAKKMMTPPTKLQVVRLVHLTTPRDLYGSLVIYRSRPGHDIYQHEYLMTQRRISRVLAALPNHMRPGYRP